MCELTERYSRDMKQTPQPTPMKPFIPEVQKFVDFTHKDILFKVGALNIDKSNENELVSDFRLRYIVFSPLLLRLMTRTSSLSSMIITSTTSRGSDIWSTMTRKTQKIPMARNLCG